MTHYGVVLFFRCGRDGGGGCSSLLAASFVPLQLSPYNRKHAARTSYCHELRLRRSVKTSRLSLRKGWIFRLTIAMSAKRELQPPPPSLVFAPVGKDRISPLYLEKKRCSLFMLYHCIWNGRYFFSTKYCGTVKYRKRAGAGLHLSWPVPVLFRPPLTNLLYSLSE